MSTAKTTAISAAVLLGIALIYVLRGLVISLLLAITLASAIAPLAERLEKYRVHRLFTVIGVYIIVLIVYVAITIYLAPVLWEQAIQLYQQLPSYMAGFTQWYHELLELAGPKVEAITGAKPETIAFSTGDVRSAVIKIIQQTLDVTAGIIGLMLNAILILFLAAYFVVEADEIWPKLLRWVPPHRRERVAALIRPLGARMGGYVRGQVLVSIAVAAFLATGLSLIGVKYALVLGVLAGLLNLMPFVGSLLTAAFSILVACSQSLLLGGLTVGLFAIEQWFESNVIVPQLLGRQVELHPVLVLFAILIGATLMGLAGALVAVPVASAALLLVEEFYIKPLNSAEAAPESA